MSTHADTTREAFVQYLRQGLLPANTPEKQRMSVTLYRLLSGGTPVTREQLGVACGFSQERVGQLLKELPAAALELNRRGAFLGFGGLSLRPTRHRLSTGEVELHTWCVR